MPGSHHGAWLAKRLVDASQSYMSVATKGCSHPETPDVWLITCRTSMFSLPFAANSGQYFATGANGSSSPRSTRIRAARLVTVFVVDQTFVMVCSVHGVRCS